MDAKILPLKRVARPAGWAARSTLYKMNEIFPGLLRRIPGQRDTYVHLPTLAEIEATAIPISPRKRTAE